MKFVVERFNDVQPEIEALVHEHWTEVTSDGGSMPLDIDWGLYQHLDSLGFLFLLSARNAHGAMVGYVLHVVLPNGHYKTVKTAKDDAHFLKKEYRLGSTGIKMIKAAEVELIKMGVTMICYHTKTRHDLDRSSMFERLGYHCREKIMVKVVKED